MPIASVAPHFLRNSEMHRDHGRALSAAFLPRVEQLLNPMHRFAFPELFSEQFADKNERAVD